MSGPPYLIVAQIVSVERRRGRDLISYELIDHDGATLGRVSHALLDDTWYRAFKPLVRRWG